MASRKSIEEQARERLEKLKEARDEQLAKRRDIAKNRAKFLTTNMVIATIVITVGAVLFSMVGLYYMAALVVVAMLPALMAYITDVRPGKLGSKTVLGLNLAGLFPSIVGIVSSGTPDQAAKAALEAPQTWLLVYGFSFVGWVLVYLIPYIIQLYMEIHADFTIKILEGKKTKLEDEWGDGVKDLVKRHEATVKAMKRNPQLAAAARKKNQANTS